MDKCNTKIIANQVRADNALANISTDLQAAILKVVHARRAYKDFMNTPRVCTIYEDVLQREKLHAAYHACCSEFYTLKDRKVRAALDLAEELSRYDVRQEIPVHETCEINVIGNLLKLTA